MERNFNFLKEKGKHKSLFKKKPSLPPNYDDHDPKDSLQPINEYDLSSLSNEFIDEYDGKDISELDNIINGLKQTLIDKSLEYDKLKLDASNLSIYINSQQETMQFLIKTNKEMTAENGQIINKRPSLHRIQTIRKIQLQASDINHEITYQTKQIIASNSNNEMMEIRKRRLEEAQNQDEAQTQYTQKYKELAKKHAEILQKRKKICLYDETQQHLESIQQENEKRSNTIQNYNNLKTRYEDLTQELEQLKAKALPIQELYTENEILEAKVNSLYDQKNDNDVDSFAEYLDRILSGTQTSQSRKDNKTEQTQIGHGDISLKTPFQKEEKKKLLMKMYHSQKKAYKQQVQEFRNSLDQIQKSYQSKVSSMCEFMNWFDSLAPESFFNQIIENYENTLQAENDE